MAYPTECGVVLPTICAVRMRPAAFVGLGINGMMTVNTLAHPVKEELTLMSL